MSFIFTSESVTAGHPDKVCDQISDAILDAYLWRDPHAAVAVETFATSEGVTLGGEVSSTADVDREAVARQTLAEIGYTAQNGYDPATVAVRDQVTRQSGEIAGAVFGGIEQGAGDQGLMFGYATSATSTQLPEPISLAHEAARLLSATSLGGRLLGPDGKVQVSVEYDDEGEARGLHTVLVSTQHRPGVSREELEWAVIPNVISPLAQASGLDVTNMRMIVNPAGAWTRGGPASDTGLTGRKIIVDTYGGMARHGGGAFSGKDPSKVDRSAAYFARYVARGIVEEGIAKRAELQVAYAIGQARPVSLLVETFGTGDRRAAEAYARRFDYRPAAIIERLDLRKPIYRQTAAYGHFGRRGLPWEAARERGD